MANIIAVTWFIFQSFLNHTKLVKMDKKHLFLIVQKNCYFLERCRFSLKGVAELLSMQILLKATFTI
jgi:hypothetical protein